jgi:uncharacterized coiled-coil DUF342 family protein
MAKGPTLAAPSSQQVTSHQPKVANQTAPDWKTYKSRKPNLSGQGKRGENQTPKAESSRLDAIYAQLKELQNFKDEIMDDLEEFMDDFEEQSVQKQIAVPQQFDEVVDIVVSDSRQKAVDV